MKETVMLEIPNVFEKEKPTIATLSRTFNIDASRFNGYQPVPMFRKAAAEKRAVTAQDRPDSYILLVDHDTAAVIDAKLQGRTTVWSNPPIQPS